MKKKYDCKNCCYRRRDVNFCGFCMRKILDEMAGRKRPPNGTEGGQPSEPAERPAPAAENNEESKVNLK